MYELAFGKNLMNQRLQTKGLSHSLEAPCHLLSHLTSTSLTV